MTIKQQLIPLRIGKGLLSLVALFVMLLAPQRAWATVFTTSTLAEATEGDAKYTWTVEGLGAFSVNPKYDWDENGVTMSSNPIGITVGGYYGCTLSLKGAVPNDPDNYNNIIYKVKIIGVNDNSDITVKLDKSSGDPVTFIASTVPGEFYVPNSVIWASNEELSIEVGKECTITGIEVYRSTVSTETSYGFQGNPISNGPIQGALQEDQTIAINLFNYQGYYYPLYVNGSTNTSTNITYSSSNESVATVSSDGSVNIKKTGSTTIIATVQDNDDNLTFGYTLTVNFPAPTISPNGGHQLANAEITFGYEGATNTPDFKYKWGENGETISYGTAHPTVQTGTLTAWVEVMPSGSQTAIKSEEATATFTAVGGTSYGLTVGGVPVTSENYDNVLGDERQDHQVTFDNDSHKLTLNNANLNGNIVSNIDLEVEFIGSNHIDLPAGSGDYALVGNGTANLSFTNTGKDVNPLTIMYGNGLMSNWGTESVDVNTEERDEKDDWWLNSYTGTSCEFKLMYNEKFDLWIGKDENTQIQVCNFNKDNVVNDNSWDHSVSFEPATEYSPATLILNSYQSETNTTQPFITNGISELDIMLKGNNQIHSGPLFLTKSGTDNSDNTVTFTTDLENPGNLTIRAHGEEGVDWHSGHTINYENGLMKLSEYYDGEYFANTVMIEMPESFGISVAGTLVTPNNMTNVLSDDNNYKVSFDPNTNTLNMKGATVVGDIETSIDNLIISLSENNTLTGSIKYTGDSETASLSFDANLGRANSASLTLSTESQEIGVVSGFNTVSVNAPLETTVTDWTNTVKSATITAECYDIRVAGVLITKGNKENVLGTPEGTAPTVSFTPAEGNDPATLTLNNATIDLTKYESSGIIYQGTANLTIKLVGANSIKVQYNCEPIIYDVYPLPNTIPTLTFERGSSPCSLELQTSGNDPVIRYFGNVLGVNGIKDATDNVATDNLLKLDSEVAVTYTQENGLHTVQGNETTPVTSAKIVSVLKDPEFCFSDSENSAIADGDTISYYYGYEQTLPVLKRWENGYTSDLSGFTITYTSSNENVATISNTGVITIVGGGWAKIQASIEATGDYAADEAWFTMEVIPAVPQVSIDKVSIEEGGAYFTGQKLKIKTDAQGGDLYYSYGYEKDESKRTPYDGEEISLPKGEYLFYPYTRCGTGENSIWSDNWPIELYVYDEPTIISEDEGDYVGDIEVEITNLPNPPHRDNVSVTAYYYLGDDDDNEENDIRYTAGDKITVRESTKLNVYLLVEGDSGKRYKTKVIERQYTIKDIPLDVTAADFHNHWMTYYHNENGNVGLPENQNIGAYVATSISGNEIVVTQIKSIPRGEPVLLNNETTTTTDNVFGQDVQGNLLKHATEAVQLDEECDYYGLYNGAFERVKTIPAGKNYLMVSNAVVPGGHAPKLTIVFDNEATGVNDVRSKMEDVRGDIYDLQGRKVQKPSKKGLYINKGHKVVVK